ncbi:MAG: hypothetical protein EA403_10950 [Spirochaetaceae bacterium]|nr:MAG: hypothetical protein EA403_10950 [Spirochaetaceae bacterium]
MVAEPKLLEALPLHEIIRCASAGNYQGRSTAYDGAARRHPYDSSRILLVPSPMDHLHLILEFQIADILHAEQLHSVAAETGESLQIMRLWVRHGSVGVRMEPFRVEARS